MASPVVGDAVALADGRTVSIRPVAPGDAAAIQAFIGSLSPDSRYRRFFLAYRELPPDSLARMVEIDQSRDAVLLALAASGDGAPVIVGMAQYAGESDVLGVQNHGVEVAVVVGEDWRKAGLATLMLSALAKVASAHGVDRVEAEILRDNTAAIRLAARLAAEIAPSAGSPHLVHVSKRLVPNLPMAAAAAMSEV